MVSAPPAAGQAYPAKAIRIVVPFPAGGTSDILSRAIGQKLTEEWKQPVIVENRPGAGANIGAEVVVKAAPDGYTLLCASTIHTINPSLYSKLAYDPVRDFTPITLVAATSQVLGVISRSSGELKSVFEAILENATRLCDAKFGNLLLYEHGAFRRVALYGAPRAWAESTSHRPVIPPNACAQRSHISCAAPIDQESRRADSRLQNRRDLGAAQRRYNESVAASIHSLAREANYG